MSHTHVGQPMNPATQLLTDECRYCGAAITLAEDGAWNDDAGACGCGVGEHDPGGYSEYANAERTAETPWWS